MLKLLTRFSTYTLLVALSISVVAEFYSIVGLTSIFAAAVIPTVIMGVVLGLGKLTATVWLKLNWDRAPLSYKLYLIPAIVVLMFLTSMGIFGFLSKAHSDQSLVSGDVQSKIAIYDEKIKTERENIETNRRALKQMDDAVDQVMGRSQDEKGADKAVQIRRSQQKERTRLLADITTAQQKIAVLNEERAPIAAEVRKVEAEVGPIKYIAALIYGDTTDTNLLESAVRWVIIIIVAVFDPLALMLLLAAQQSFRWERQQDEEEQQRLLDEQLNREELELEQQRFNEQLRLEEQRLAEQQEIETANELIAEVEREVPEVIIPEPEIDLVAEANELLAELEPEVAEVILPVEPAYEPDDGPLSAEQLRQIKELAQQPVVKEESDPTIECHKCGTELINAPGIGPFCPNKECDVLDGPFNDLEPIEFTYIPPEPVVITEEPVVEVVEEPTVDMDMIVSSDEITVDTIIAAAAVSDIETEDVTKEKVLFGQNGEQYVVFEGKKMSIENLKSIRPDLVLPSNGVVPNKIDFGSAFPNLSLAGDTYIRTDVIPHRVYKFNGTKWMNVDKDQNTTYLTHVPYLRFLIQKLEQNEYDAERLTYAEQDEIEAYILHKKK
jgi:hypothetical protein